MQSQDKLDMAINLINVGKAIEGLRLIIDVYETEPDYLDPLVRATVPLYRSIVKNMTKNQSKMERDWASNAS